MKPYLTRRELLNTAGRGFGALALASECSERGHQQSRWRRSRRTFPARAKAVIHLFMHGGVSHVDTFDPKPELTRTQWPDHLGGDGQGPQDQLVIDFAKAPMRGSPWKFQRRPRGIEISDLYPGIASKADEIAVDPLLLWRCVRSCARHLPAQFRLAVSRTAQPGLLGHLWSRVGESEPAGVRGDVGRRHEVGTAASTARASCRRCIRARSSAAGEYPVLNLAHPKASPTRRSATRSTSSRELNQQHLAAHPDGTELEARIASYELAFRMQSSAPEAVDLSKESDATKKLYGIGETTTDDFGRKCLLRAAWWNAVCASSN